MRSLIVESKFGMVQIRPATINDREDIASVHVASIRGIAGDFYSQEQINVWSSGKRPDVYPVEEHKMFVAVEDGKVIGFSELRIQDEEVRAVYIAPTAVRRGVGSMLLEAVERQAKERGLARLKLGASLNAIHFYTKHGYRKTGSSTMTTASGIPYWPMEKKLLGTLRIRPAVSEDGAGIGRVHVETWRTTYRGIVPDEHLAGLSQEKRIVFWTGIISDMPPTPASLRRS